MRFLFARQQQSKSAPHSKSGEEDLSNHNSAHRRTALSLMSAGILSTIGWSGAGRAATPATAPSAASNQTDGGKKIDAGMMRTHDDTMATLLAKDQIHQLALLYSRGIDRKDFALLRSIFAKDGTADYGDYFVGSTKDLVDKFEQGLPQIYYTGHHVCNHLITVDGNEGEGEVYVIAYHLFVKPDGTSSELIGNTRYMDRYRKEGGRWFIAHRTEHNDLRTNLPVPTPSAPAPSPLQDRSVTELKNRLFARGGRA